MPRGGRPGSVDGTDISPESVNAERLSTDVEIERTDRRSRTRRFAGERRHLAQSYAQRGSETTATVVGWIFDDGRISVYENRDIFESNNIEATLAIATSIVGTSGQMTWDQIDELCSPPYNFTLASHGKSNVGFDSRTEDEMEEDVYDAHATFVQKAHEYSNPDLIPEIYVYAFGQAPALGRAIVSELYSHAFSATDGDLGENTSPLAMRRYGTGQDDITTIEGWVDDAVSGSDCLMFMGHDITTDGPSNEGSLETSRTKFQNIVDYVNSNAQWGTVADVLDQITGWHFGNDTNRIYETNDGILRMQYDEDFRVETSFENYRWSPGNGELKIGLDDGQFFSFFDRQTANKPLRLVDRGFGADNTFDLSGTTGDFDGQLQRDDGTNTADGNPAYCEWRATPGEWRELGAGTENTFT